MLALRLFACATAVIALAGCSGTHESSPGVRPQTTTTADAAPSDPDSEVTVGAGKTRCGVERWPVKTGTDPDVGKIDLSAQPTHTTIAELVARRPPNPIPPNNRVAPTETTVYRIYATLIAYKLESDSDYHLVLSDGTHTMIAEIPSPSCVMPDPLRTGISNARSEFDAAYHPVPTIKHLNVPVTVTGVGMFDFLHHQDGVAPNGIELHPVIDIKFG